MDDLKVPMEGRLSSCPVCESNRLHYAFSVQGYRLVQCEDCTLLMINPQPGESVFDQFDQMEQLNGAVNVDEICNVFNLEEVERYRGSIGGELLAVGVFREEFLSEAAKRGYTVTKKDFKAFLNATAGPAVRRYDVCLLSTVVERCPAPVEFLSRVHSMLKPWGVLGIVTPALDSRPARLLKSKWRYLSAERLFYFSSTTMQNVLFKCNFRNILVLWPSPTARTGGGKKARNGSNMLVLASAATGTERKKLSVVVPVFNESATFEAVMEALLAKRLPDMDLEIVVVESNSTDGTREKALRYEKHPRVKLVLEEQPRGKGRAVRRGLEHISGDFVIIQDADLEYDIEDYEPLLMPLIQCRKSFVIGARHGGNAWWKMRRFSDQKVACAVVNFGHWLFTTFINLVYGLRLKDPQTMFKVFRSDCLYGLTFRCNHFDFDYELLTKLSRKGFKPTEIPVNYTARSFKEGKKISIWKDPLRGIWALIWLRFVPIDPLGEVARRHDTISTRLIEKRK